MIEFIVYGTPGPQGSKRHVGKGIMVESSAKVKPWREAVKYAALMAMKYTGIRPTAYVEGPVELEVVFTLPKPKSAPKRRVTVPDRTPDLSKLIRSTEDALTDVGLWEDDARVVRCKASKVYPNEGEHALNAPGAYISVRQLSLTTIDTRKQT